MESGRCAVVFDTGSSTTRVGLSRDATPTTFPTLVTMIDDALFVGHQPNGRKKRVLDGIVQNWDYLPKIWDHGFKLLNIEPENHPVVLNKSDYPYKSENEKMAQIMFEEFNVPALHLNYQSVLSLYGHGCLTGLVVESGFCKTQFYPVYEGHVLQGIMGRGLPVAGDYLTYFLCDSLQKKGYKCDYETVNKIKEKSIYVSIGPSKENAFEETVSLPDGNSITLSKEKYLIPEELYTPSFQCCGIEEYIYRTLHRCNPELRKTFCENIVLSGGNTQLPGFAERLEKELIKAGCNSKFMQLYVPKITKTSGQNSVWIGGAVLASLPTFLDMCMTKEEYNDYGPTLVNTKFF